MLLSTVIATGPCPSSGGTLTVTLGDECHLDPGLHEYETVQVDGTLVANSDPDTGQYVTLRVSNQLHVAFTGLLTSKGLGFRPEEGPGGGVVQGQWGSGGMEAVVYQLKKMLRKK